MERYFHKDHARKTCVTAYPNLELNHKIVQNRVFSKNMSNIRHVVLQKTLLHVCEFFIKNLTRKHEKELTTY